MSINRIDYGVEILIGGVLAIMLAMFGFGWIAGKHSADGWWQAQFPRVTSVSDTAGHTFTLTEQPAGIGKPQAQSDSSSEFHNMTCYGADGKPDGCRLIKQYALAYEIEKACPQPGGTGKCTLKLDGPLYIESNPKAHPLKLGKRKPAPQQGGCTPEMGPGCAFIDNSPAPDPEVSIMVKDLVNDAWTMTEYARRPGYGKAAIEESANKIEADYLKIQYSLRKPPLGVSPICNGDSTDIHGDCWDRDRGNGPWRKIHRVIPSMALVTPCPDGICPQQSEEKITKRFCEQIRNNCGVGDSHGGHSCSEEERAELLKDMLCPAGVPTPQVPQP